MKLMCHWPLPGWLGSERFWKDRQVLGENWGEELPSRGVGSSEEPSGCSGGCRYGGLDRESYLMARDNNRTWALGSGSLRPPNL